MFKKARVKLTVWYLLIIMLISSVFSLVIYSAITGELERGFRRTEMRLRTQELELPFFGQSPRLLEEINSQILADLEAAKKRVALFLLMVNAGILAVSSAAGYFLAGKTLKPIEVVMEEQKRFVADASHELRTPLTALKTVIEVALREKKMTVSESKKVLESSLEDVDGLESLVNNLLSLTQYQEGNGNFTYQDLDISELVKNAYKKIAPLAKKKNVKIKLKSGSQIVEANRLSLEQMLVIFLDNAVKYTSKGGQVTLLTKSDKKNLIVKIKDTGIGISKAEIPHIFDRFYRADQSRSKDNVPGFGLGLSLAIRIIDIHKGSVKVASVLGEGTSFTVKLPFKHS